MENCDNFDNIELEVVREIPTFGIDLYKDR